MEKSSSIRCFTFMKEDEEDDRKKMTDKHVSLRFKPSYLPWGKRMLLGKNYCRIRSATPSKRRSSLENISESELAVSCALYVSRKNYSNFDVTEPEFIIYCLRMTRVCRTDFVREISLFSKEFLVNES